MAILNPFAEDFPHENPSVFRAGVFPAIFDDTVQTQVQPSKLKTCCARSWLSSHDGNQQKSPKKVKNRTQNKTQGPLLSLQLQITLVGFLNRLLSYGGLSYLKPHHRSSSPGRTSSGTSSTTTGFCPSRWPSSGCNLSMAWGKANSSSRTTPLCDNARILAGLGGLGASSWCCFY